ncbi:hypothetical protein OAK91_04810, partial [Planctomycetaceae bacterium]|nr:hypothetical protein [Planctomycetaceae bacterium]
MYRFDPEVQDFMEEAVETGFLTFQKLDKFIPDEGPDSTLMEKVLLAMEEYSLHVQHDPSCPEENDPTSFNNHVDR